MLIGWLSAFLWIMNIVISVFLYIFHKTIMINACNIVYILNIKYTSFTKWIIVSYKFWKFFFFGLFFLHIKKWRRCTIIPILLNWKYQNNKPNKGKECGNYSLLNKSIFKEKKFNTNRISQNKVQQVFCNHNWGSNNDIPLCLKTKSVLKPTK